MESSNETQVVNPSGVQHHFSDQLYAKEIRLTAGQKICQHKHTYSHLAVLASGQVNVTVGNETVHYVSPKCIDIKANTNHEIEACTDVVWYCIHQTDEKDESTIDKTLIAPSLPIKLLLSNLNVQQIVWNLHVHPELWNKHTDRTKDFSSPHYGIDDIWIRYAEGGNVTSKEHESVWYPSADILNVKPLVMDVFKAVNGTSLGGVLITRIIPGKWVKPHRDLGWHAKNYDKFAVQLTSSPHQAFCFEKSLLESKPGDLYWFNNQELHWVENNSEYERITMIICVKR